jgi:heterodisulfide reductase subunit A
MYKIPLNPDGFLTEAHMKLRPVDCATDGVFICGTAHYPKPLEESIAQARAAAARAAGILVRHHIEVEPLVSVVDSTRCVGCGLCEASCAFGAIRLNKIAGVGFRAETVPALCKGCGVCAAGCPHRAIDMMHFRDGQILASVAAGGDSALAAKRAYRSRAKVGAARVSGYLAPDDYLYHFGHCWVRPEAGGRLRVGVDDFILKALGTPGLSRVPAPGSVLRQDRDAWEWVRNGHRAGVLAPVTGKVFSVNRASVEHPERILEDPFGEGWLLVVEPTVPGLELKRLYAGDGMIEWMEGEKARLMEMLGPEYDKLAATGGEPIGDVFGRLPHIGWERLVKAFLKGGR